MVKPLVLEGDLWLRCQEGGYADDAFVFVVVEDPSTIAQLARVLTNLHIGDDRLDDIVAGHFGAKREKPIGDRHIAPVPCIALLFHRNHLLNRI